MPKLKRLKNNTAFFMLLLRVFLLICPILVLASEARGQYYYDTTYSKPRLIGSLKMSLLLGGEGFLSDTAFRQALKPIYSYPKDLTFIRFGAQFIFGNDMLPFEGVFQFGKVYGEPSSTISGTTQSVFNLEGNFMEVV